MKYLNIFFLVVLLSPFAYSQTDEAIMMLQKTPEGKDVLDSIYLQVSMEGPNIKIENVRNRLKAMESYSNGFIKKLKTTMSNAKKRCNNDLGLTNGRFHDMTSKALYSRRQYDHFRRSQERRGVFLQRAAEELRYYTKFNSMIGESSKKWNKFYASGLKSKRKILSLISQIKAQVRKLHKAHTKTAFIELPNNYVSALTEISSQFENTFDEVGGFRPIISNLLEVIKDPKNHVKKQARRVMRKLLAKISYRIRAQFEKYEEENEHQKELFSSLHGLFSDSMKGAKKILTALGEKAEKAVITLTQLKTVMNEATQLASDARDIVDLMQAECQFEQQYLKKTIRRGVKLLLYITQVQEVISDRWNALRSFFVEKMENPAEPDEANLLEMSKLQKQRLPNFEGIEMGKQ